jgi:ABC-type microcin C transport system permease subunit YejE
MTAAEMSIAITAYADVFAEWAKLWMLGFLAISILIGLLVFVGLVVRRAMSAYF